jgi:hypothetical protein
MLTSATPRTGLLNTRLSKGPAKSSHNSLVIIHKKDSLICRNYPLIVPHFAFRFLLFTL